MQSNKSNALRLIILEYGAHTVPVATAARSSATGILVEVQAARAVGTTLVRRSTPVATVRLLVVGRRTEAPTGGREEDAVAILLAGYLIAFMAVLDCPFPGAVA